MKTFIHNYNFLVVVPRLFVICLLVVHAFFFGVWIGKRWRHPKKMYDPMKLKPVTVGKLFNINSPQRLPYGDMNGKGVRTSIPMFYMNLERSVQRRLHMEQTFGSWGELVRIPAVTIAELPNLLHFPNPNWTLEDYRKAADAYGLGEIALSLTALSAIRQAYQKGHDAVLLFEDDMSDVLVPLWRWTLDEIVEMANIQYPHWSLIQLQQLFVGEDRIYVDLWKQNPDSPFIPYSALPSRVTERAFGGGASLISRRGMEHLIKEYFTMSGKFDCLKGKAGCVPDKIYNRQKDKSNWQMLMVIPPMFTYILNEGCTGTRMDGNDRTQNDDFDKHYLSILDSFRSAFEASSRVMASIEVANYGKGENSEDDRLLPYMNSCFEYNGKSSQCYG